MEDKNKLELSVMLNEFGSIGTGEFIQFAKKNFFFLRFHDVWQVLEIVGNWTNSRRPKTDKSLDFPF